MKNLSRFAAAAGVASAGLGLFGLTAGPASAAAAATISPSTNVPDCNSETIPPGTPCTKSTVTATGFPPNSRVALIECPNANVTDPGFCDNTTTDFGPGSGYSTDASGNFTTTVFPALKVPTEADKILGNDPGFVCDETTSCVVAVVTGTTFDFTLPKAFTQPFTFAAAPPPPPPPPADVPEVPWAAVLPLGALALCGSSYLVLRNRSRSSASAA